MLWQSEYYKKVSGLPFTVLGGIALTLSEDDPSIMLHYSGIPAELRSAEYQPSHKMVRHD